MRWSVWWPSPEASLTSYLWEENFQEWDYMSQARAGIICQRWRVMGIKGGQKKGQSRHWAAFQSACVMQRVRCFLSVSQPQAGVTAATNLQNVCFGFCFINHFHHLVILFQDLHRYKRPSMFKFLKVEYYFNIVSAHFPVYFKSSLDYLWCQINVIVI